MLLSIGFTILLSLINLGSHISFRIVTSLAAASLMASYGLATGCVMLRRIRKQPLPPAPWSLGKASLPVNCVATIYSVWCTFWCFWPAEGSAGATHINWAILLFVGIIGFACVLYHYGPKRKAYKPVLKMQLWTNEW